MNPLAGTCDRRSFLTMGLAVLGSSLLSFRGSALGRTVFPATRRDAPRPSGTLALYLDESGTPGGRGLLVLGLLAVWDPARHLRKIQELRRKHRFHTQLRYSTTDRFRRAYAAEVIEYATSQPDLRFSTAVLRRSARRGCARYHEAWRRLIDENVPEGVPLELHVVRRGRADRRLRAYLQSRIPRITKIHIVEARREPLMQVADLLTGSVYGATADSPRGGTSGGDAKRDIIESLRAKLA